MPGEYDVDKVVVNESNGQLFCICKCVAALCCVQLLETDCCIIIGSVNIEIIIVYLISSFNQHVFPQRNMVMMVGMVSA